MDRILRRQNAAWARRCENDQQLCAGACPPNLCDAQFDCDPDDFAPNFTSSPIAQARRFNPPVEEEQPSLQINILQPMNRNAPGRQRMMRPRARPPIPGQWQVDPCADQVCGVAIPRGPPPARPLANCVDVQQPVAINIRAVPPRSNRRWFCGRRADVMDDVAQCAPVCRPNRRPRFGEDLDAQVGGAARGSFIIREFDDGREPELVLVPDDDRLI